MPKPLRIPLEFSDALSGLLKVKPPPKVAKPEKARTAKRPAVKRAGKKR